METENVFNPNERDDNPPDFVPSDERDDNPPDFVPADETSNEGFPPEVPEWEESMVTNG